MSTTKKVLLPKGDKEMSEYLDYMNKDHREKEVVDSALKTKANPKPAAKATAPSPAAPEKEVDAS